MHTAITYILQALIIIFMLNVLSIFITGLVAQYYGSRLAIRYLKRKHERENTSAKEGDI